MQHLLQPIEREAEFAGELLVGGGPVVSRLEPAVGPFELPSFRPDRSRHPVGRSEMIENGSLDARHGVRLELESPLGFELLDGVEQAEHARRHQFAHLHGLGKACPDPVGNELHEGRVVEHQAVAIPGLGSDR